MRYLKLKDVEEVISIDKHTIYAIVYENYNRFSTIINLIKTLDYTDEIHYFDERYTSINISKETIFIDNPLFFEFNDKKLLTYLYKGMSEKLTDEQKSELVTLNQSLILYLKSLSYKYDGDILIDDEIPLSKLCSLYNVRFNEDYTSLVSKITNYIKNIKNFRPLNALFTLDLIKYLNEKEIQELISELNYLEVSLIDISFRNDFRKMAINQVLIDNDLCETFSTMEK